eukprot:TRINITY_DN10917_c0_g1_i1.p1 TRINITY_DN10917_c0_g1~~TRINITY_DN10917_c0_g1_i1.p1  ORF type:complete len:147 (+),score=27.62 TRINITY_DN10917_c0_g1_i1:2-442(+)
MATNTEPSSGEPKPTWTDFNGDVHEGFPKIEQYSQRKEHDMEVLKGHDLEHHSIVDRTKAAFGAIGNSIAEHWHEFIEHIPGEDVQEWVEEHPYKHSVEPAEKVERDPNVKRFEYPDGKPTYVPEEELEEAKAKQEAKKEAKHLKP